jgi:hypothetical protein
VKSTCSHILSKEIPLPIFNSLQGINWLDLPASLSEEMISHTQFAAETSNQRTINHCSERCPQIIEASPKNTNLHDTHRILAPEYSGTNFNKKQECNDMGERIGKIQPICPFMTVNGST